MHRLHNRDCSRRTLDTSREDQECGGLLGRTEAPERSEFAFQAEQIHRSVLRLNGKACRRSILVSGGSAPDPPIISIVSTDSVLLWTPDCFGILSTVVVDSASLRRRGTRLSMLHSRPRALRRHIPGQRTTASWDAVILWIIHTCLSFRAGHTGDAAAALWVLILSAFCPCDASTGETSVQSFWDGSIVAGWGCHSAGQTLLIGIAHSIVLIALTVSVGIGTWCLWTPDSFGILPTVVVDCHARSTGEALGCQCFTAGHWVIAASIATESSLAVIDQTVEVLQADSLVNAVTNALFEEGIASTLRTVIIVISRTESLYTFYLSDLEVC